MIPRTLVPTAVRPADPAELDGARSRRGSTLLDSRQLVPSDLPAVALDARSNIPSHVPLEVLGNRQLVPRDMPATPLETRSNIPTHVPLTVLDSRVVVPKGAKPFEVRPHAVHASADVAPPDIFTTGEVQFLPRTVEADTTGWHVRGHLLGNVGSVIAHAVLLMLVLLQPRLFPFQPHTEEQNEAASRVLGMVYLPPSPVEVAPAPPIATPQPRAQIRVDPRLFQRENPEAEVPKELTPTPPARANPEPGGGEVAPQPERPQLVNPSRPEPSRQRAQLEPPKRPEFGGAPFALPGSPGKALEESLRSAGKERTRDRKFAIGGPIPGGPLGSGTSGGGQAYGLVEILTPTEGVDFSNYLARVYASVRRNWMAVIPQSAWLGERGKVVLQFRIMREGGVPPDEPQLVRTSGRHPLDFAAMSSVRTSNPFEPLPSQFSGPFIELRFTYLYNLPLDTP